MPLTARRSRVHFDEGPGSSEHNGSLVTPREMSASPWNGQLPPLLLQTLASDSLKSPRSVFRNHSHSSSGQRLSISEDPLAEEVQLYMQDKEGILGGELVVRILCAQDLVDVSRKKGYIQRQKTMTASDHGEGLPLRRLSIPERSMSAPRRSLEVPSLDALAGPIESKSFETGDLKFQRKGFFAVRIPTEVPVLCGGTGIGLCIRVLGTTLACLAAALAVAHGPLVDSVDCL